MLNKRMQWTVGMLLFLGVWVLPVGADDVLPDSDLITRAMVDELARSMELQMEDLEKPYFIQYSIEDTIMYRISASYGSLTGSKRARSRVFYSRTRVGSYELDNTNFTGSGRFFFGGCVCRAKSSLKACRAFFWVSLDKVLPNIGAIRMAKFK